MGGSYCVIPPDDAIDAPQHGMQCPPDPTDPAVRAGITAPETLFPLHDYLYGQIIPTLFTPVSCKTVWKNKLISQAYCKVCFIDNYILLWAETLHRSTVTTNTAVCCSLWFPSFVFCISLSCEIIFFPPLSSANCLGLCTILIVKLCQWTKGSTFTCNNTQPIADYLLLSI